MKYLFIGVGGIAGSLFRFFISYLSAMFLTDGFPFGTLFVNLTGALMLGFFTAKVNNSQINPHVKLAIGTGAIGSYTTLSTLSMDFVFLIENTSILLAFLYLFVSVMGGLLAVYAGFQLGRRGNYVH